MGGEDSGRSKHPGPGSDDSVPVRSTVDGPVLGETLETPPGVCYTETQPEMRPEAGLDEKESAEVEERLRGLGYL